MTVDNKGRNDTGLTHADAAELVGSWELSMRAARKSDNTIKSYLTGVRLYLAWCRTAGLATVLDRRSATAWIASLVQSGAGDSTVYARQCAIRAYSAWLTDEEELDRDQLRTMPAVKVDTKVVDHLSDAQLAALVKACNGKAFPDRRDEAIIRLLVDTGMRANELTGLDITDVDLHGRVATIRKAKGGKSRRVPFGPSTAAVLDRYLRARRSHTAAASPALFLGRTARLSYSGLRDAIRARGAAAGVTDLHSHLFRHTASTRWLDAGGSESGLMAMGGWSRRDMLDRYTAGSAERRLAEERARLDLPEI